ncbi:MAG: AAA family ATPase [Actinomycetota bacterium]
MRPLNLILQGFRSHRQRTEVDFEDRSLIAIVGPTGSGKSSLLDGITYALYGKTPRLTSATKSLICSRTDSAEVQLRFEVDGRIFTVNRSMRRTGAGLHVLTDDAGEKIHGEKEVNRRVEELVGLDFGAFSSTVLLPQGKFSDFLEATPKAQMAILKGVFRFGQLDEMWKAAKRHRDDLAGDLREIEGRRSAIPDDLDARIKDQRVIVKDLEARSKALEDAVPKEKKLLDAVARSEEKLASLDSRLAELSELDELPSVEEVRELAEARGQLDQPLADATKIETDLKKEQAAARKALESLEKRFGTVAELGSIRAKCERLDEARADRGEIERNIADLNAALEPLQAAAEAAREAETKARAALETVRAEREALVVAHAAHSVRVKLVVGEPCPVCEQDVSKLPAATAPAELGAMEPRERAANEALDAAQREMRSNAEKLSGAERDVANAEKALTRELKRIEDLDSDIVALLGAHKDPLAEVERRLGELRDADEKLAKTTELLEDARAELEALQLRRAELDEQQHAIVDDLAHVASTLKLPRVDRKDPIDVLVTRAQEIHAAVTSEIAAVEKERGAVEKKTLADERAVEDLRKSLDLTPDVPIEEACRAEGKALAAAQTEARQLDAYKDQLKVLEADEKDARSRHEVYVQLADDLRDGNFIDFLLEEKRKLLSDLGSQQLKAMTGRYRFDDEGAFRIVDEFDGDKIRDVDTLSGGETFLASLSLALGLADAVSQQGGRLQSFFLDEGFGSLDPESLDQALDGIERVVAQDRLIGLVSHVPGLAQRVEDRIVLDKDPDGLTVVVSGAAVG